MVGLKDRLRNLLTDSTTSSTDVGGESDSPGSGPNWQGGDTVQKNADLNLYAPTEETVPNLRLMDDSSRVGEDGFNPYETTTDFKWKSGS